MSFLSHLKLDTQNCLLSVQLPSIDDTPGSDSSRTSTETSVNTQVTVRNSRLPLVFKYRPDLASELLPHWSRLRSISSNRILVLHQHFQDASNVSSLPIDGEIGLQTHIYTNLLDPINKTIQDLQTTVETECRTRYYSSIGTGSGGRPDLGLTEKPPKDGTKVTVELKKKRVVGRPGLEEIQSKAAGEGGLRIKWMANKQVVEGAMRIGNAENAVVQVRRDEPHLIPNP